MVALTQPTSGDGAILGMILALFHDATAREAARGMSMRKVDERMGRSGTRQDSIAVLQRLERAGLVTWASVPYDGLRVWPTPVAVRHAHRNTFRGTAS